METDEALVVCKDCNEDVPKDWRFCINCGAPLTGENQLTSNQQFKNKKLSHNYIIISDSFFAADEQTVDTKADSAIDMVTSDTVAVVTSNTVEVTTSDIEESIEITKSNKPLASSPPTPVHIGNSSSVKFTTASLYVFRKCSVICGRSTKRKLYTEQ